MISDLDTRAGLQAHTLTPDGGGGFAESWQTFATVWVKITAVGGADAAAADSRESKARHRILLRHRADLCAGQRLVAGSRRFTVRAVLDEGAAFVTLLCEELP